MRALLFLPLLFAPPPKEGRQDLKPFCSGWLLVGGSKQTAHIALRLHSTYNTACWALPPRFLMQQVWGKVQGLAFQSIRVPSVVTLQARTAHYIWERLCWGNFSSWQPGMLPSLSEAWAYRDSHAVECVFVWGGMSKCVCWENMGSPCN